MRRAARANDEAEVRLGQSHEDAARIAGCGNVIADGNDVAAGLAESEVAGPRHEARHALIASKPVTSKAGTYRRRRSRPRPKVVRRSSTDLVAGIGGDRRRRIRGTDANAVRRVIDQSVDGCFLPLPVISNAVLPFRQEQAEPGARDARATEGFLCIARRRNVVAGGTAMSVPTLRKPSSPGERHEVRDLRLEARDREGHRVRRNRFARTCT